ncbi:unnamed protein product [Microthlaspi erraticum]|uniref:Uncharacterized protein n=1 Tax=Microthlaspi erraticum TaxID=1685480 RepID=A0A6D2HHR4_9BRAS|nr:unnamed protein product [Microthlaspi erraticum]
MKKEEEHENSCHGEETLIPGGAGWEERFKRIQRQGEKMTQVKEGYLESLESLGESEADRLNNCKKRVLKFKKGFHKIAEIQNKETKRKR